MTEHEPSITLSEIEAHLSTATQERADLDVQILQVNTQIEVLSRLRNHLRKSRPILQPRVRLNGKVGVTAGIRRFVGENSFRHTAQEIAERIIDQIETEAKDPMRTIHTTIWAMKARGVLEADEQKRLGLARKWADNPK